MVFNSHGNGYNEPQTRAPSPYPMDRVENRGGQRGRDHTLLLPGLIKGSPFLQSGHSSGE